jgi:hypothetical protein
MPFKRKPVDIEHNGLRFGEDSEIDEKTRPQIEVTEGDPQIVIELHGGKKIPSTVSDISSSKRRPSDGVSALDRTIGTKIPTVENCQRLQSRMSINFPIVLSTSKLVFYLWANDISQGGASIKTPTKAPYASRYQIEILNPITGKWLILLCRPIFDKNQLISRVEFDSPLVEQEINRFLGI